MNDMVSTNDADVRSGGGVLRASNEDAEPFGLSTAAVYADLAKPFAEQSMKIEFMPLKTDLYERWRRG